METRIPNTDPQQQTMYDAENFFATREPEMMRAVDHVAAEVIAAVSDMYGMQAPRIVQFADMRADLIARVADIDTASALYSHEMRAVSFNYARMELCGMRDGLPLHVLAHELAHAVAFSSLERGKVPIEKTVCAWRSAHGPFFVGVFSYLLGALIGVDSRKIAVTFEAYGVACVDPYGVAPDTIDATVAEWYAQECEVNGAPA